jgi:hypothetical protein
MYDLRQRLEHGDGGVTMPGRAADTEQSASTGRGHGPLEKITVNLTPRTVAALELLVEVTGNSKTDSINRAIQIYSYLETVWSQGGAVYVRENADEESHMLKVI